MNQQDLKDFLEEKYLKYNAISFIEKDPISIPHRFTKKKDREIIGFLTATIAWGQRNTILKNMHKLVDWMDDSPYEFIIHCRQSDLKRFAPFVHRTFNGNDCQYFIKSLQNCYLVHGGLEKIFQDHTSDTDVDFSNTLHQFKKIFFSLPHLARTQKHIADPFRNSSSKRLCMYMRWMVRKDAVGIDFGHWSELGSARLSCPLDVHSGRVARKLGLLKRTQNDWKAVCELTNQLKKLDPVDPVKYDYALFGLGINEKF